MDKWAKCYCNLFSLKWTHSNSRVEKKWRVIELRDDWDDSSECVDTVSCALEILCFSCLVWDEDDAFWTGVRSTGSDVTVETRAIIWRTCVCPPPLAQGHTDNSREFLRTTWHLWQKKDWLYRYGNMDTQSPWVTRVTDGLKFTPCIYKRLIDRDLM